MRRLRPRASNTRRIVSDQDLYNMICTVTISPERTIIVELCNVIVSVADTRTVTRTPHPHTRDHHSLALAETRMARRTGSEAETAGTTGRGQAGETIARPRGQTDC